MKTYFICYMHYPNANRSYRFAGGRMSIKTVHNSICKCLDVYLNELNVKSDQTRCSIPQRDFTKISGGRDNQGTSDCEQGLISPELMWYLKTQNLCERQKQHMHHHSFQSWRVQVTTDWITATNNSDDAAINIKIWCKQWWNYWQPRLISHQTQSQHEFHEG